jgi:hypothetical protein
MPEDLNIHIHRGKNLKLHDSSADGDNIVYIPAYTKFCMLTSCNISTKTTDLYLVCLCL